MSETFLDGLVKRRALKPAGVSVRHEVAVAEASAQCLDLQGRACVVLDADQAAVAVDAAIERACISAESRCLSSTSGLVSVPTSDKAGRHRAREDARELKTRLRGFTPERHRARVAALRRSVGFSARAHLAERRGFRPDTVFMVTATYADGSQWRPGDISRWLKNIREWCRTRQLPCRYVWVAELQKRGAIHYHLALWLPGDVYLPASDAQGWWSHGVTRTERARGAVQYLMKYLSKGCPAESLALPPGARMYGVGGLEHSFRRARRWFRYPAFIRARADIHDDWRRAPGGGWCSPDCVVVPSEFERCWLGDSYGLRRVADYGRPFDASGPFSWVRPLAAGSAPFPL